MTKNKKILDNVFWRLLFGLILSACVFFVKEMAWELFLFKAEYENGTQKGYIFHDNLRRSYVSHLPQNDKFFNNEKVPLVLVLHGISSNADQMMESTGMNEVADRENFIVVYPNGTGVLSEYILSWNAGQCCNFIEPLGVDDVGFIRSLIDKFKGEYNIDENRMYVVGLSNGAMMSYRLGCELSESFAAIASVSGSMMVENCEPEDYLSVVSLNDEDDSIVPYKGGESDIWLIDLFDLYFNSAPESVLFWVKHNDCTEDPEESSLNGLEKKTYYDCREDTEVLFYTSKRGIHNWPGSNLSDLLTGQDDKSIEATEIVWDFFKNHIK